MNSLFNIIYSIHKWMGIPLAVLFTMWYLSGIVMLYHPFPRLTSATMPVVEADTAKLSELWTEVPDTFKSCRISYSGQHPMIKVDGEVVGKYTPTIKDIDDIEATFGTKVAKIDTLDDIDKWIPFNQLMVHLPIYRVIGEDQSYTYVSSQTGELLQHNTVSGRRWAWIGSLPHYVYITPLRRDVDTWSTTVIWISGLCTISVILGLIIAIRFLVRNHKLNMFRKRSWQWHYTFGLIFGISMLAFIFSGMMSLAKIPNWIMESKPRAESQSAIIKSDVDIAQLPDKFGEVQISSNPIALIKVVANDDTNILPINTSCPLDFSPERMNKVIANEIGEKVISVKPVERSIFYPAQDTPGYCAKTENFTIYWNNEGFFMALNAKAKAQAICYRFLHKMNFPIINRVEWIHNLFMLVLLFGGIIIVWSGAILSARAVRRKSK